MWLFFGLPILCIFVMLVIHASESLEKIKLHWNEYRCNPIYMPFAGMIRPDVGTQENMTFCLNQFGSEILKVAMDAIHSLFSVFQSSLSELMGPMNIFRNMFGRLRKFMLSFTSATLSKAANATSVFIHYLIKIRDMMKRFVGQGYLTGYLTYVIFSFLESFIVLFISILKSFVIAMLAISVVLALFQPELLVITLVLSSILAASGA